MIGGDFNAITGNEGEQIVYEEEKGKEGRRSKDKIINKEGRVMLNKLQERGWMILNGSGEEEGSWTYIGERGALVIDYVVTNDKATEEIERVEEGLRTKSDHVGGGNDNRKEERRKGEKEKKIEIEKSVWTEENRTVS